MALSSLLRRAVPLETWGNLPASRWMLAATLVAVAYVALPLTSDSTGVNLDTLFEASPVLLAGWLALLAGWLLTNRAAPTWAIHLHRGACVVYVLPAIGLVVALAVGVAVGVGVVRARV